MMKVKTKEFVLYARRHEKPMRGRFMDDKEFVLACFELACAGAASCDVTGISPSHEPWGDVRHAAVFTESRGTIYVMLKGLGPFEAIEKIIKEAKLK